MKLTNIFIVVIAFAFISSCTSEKKSDQELKQSTLSFYKHFVGTINNKYAIVMDLNKDSSSISGEYYYTKVSLPLWLTGKMKDSVSFTLNEEYKGKKTGVFKGTFVNDSTIEGTWTSADEKKNFPFRLIEDYTNSIKMKTYHSIQQISSSQENPGAFELVFQYPVYAKNPEATTKIRDFIDATIFGKDAKKNDVEANLKKLNTDFIEEYNANYDSSMARSYDRTISMKVRLNEDDIFCFSIGTWEYTGGVHGNYWDQFYVFDIKSGNQISLSDIFKDGYQEELLKQINILVKTPENGEEPIELLVDTVPITENFYLTKDYIEFYYNPYEIAPYAAGPIEVYFKFKELKTLFKENSPIYRYINKE